VPRPKQTAAVGARWLRERLGERLGERLRSGLAATSKPMTIEGIMTTAIQPGLA
jgi:hypothetical protein